MASYITGLRETIRDLERFGIEVADLKEVMASIASTATEVMQPFIPELTGKLRASARGNKAKGKAIVTVGKASIGYAAAINYGSPRQGIRGADFTGKTDAVMDDRAAEMFIDGIQDLIKKRGLDQ